MGPREKVNVLIVDDQPARLLSYDAILANLGQNLVHARSGVEALERLMRDEFAVILLDVSMPGMDGFETAQMIHQHPRFEKTPIIFVTALHVTDLDRLKGYELGAVDYVYVPVVPEILRSKVAVLVELHLKRRELQELNRTLARANEELERANSTLQAEKARELERLNHNLALANGSLANLNATLKAEMVEREHAQAAQRESEGRLRAIVQNTPAVIYQFDLAQRFVLVNRRFEELYGVTGDDVRGRSVHEVFSPEAAARAEANNRRVLAEGRPLEFEEQILESDGPHVYSNVKAPLVDDRGELCGIVVVATDVTERKRLVDALRQTDRKKDEFLAMLAHELRNPLAPILNGIQILRSKDLRDPDLTWCRGVMERQAEHMSRLIEDLLDVSRITQGKIRLRKERIELTAIVSRAIETSRALIDSRGHELVVELPAQPLSVDGDLIRLAQVVGNLLNNAAKYTDDGGRIVLRVEAASHPRSGADEVVIRVRDTGIGIPAENLGSVFELFTQVENSMDRAQGGLGIGLALVSRLVELHGGEVRATSEGPGRGSEFIVRLPARRVDALGSSRPPEAAAPPTPRRVLVVDDNVDAAESLAMLLRFGGNEVEVAFDGLEAVELAGKLRPDVVLLDIGMPTLDGYGAARRIRAHEWGRHMVLVALTGWGQDLVRTHTQEAGFNVHLVKPVDMTVLNALLAKLPDASRCIVV